MTIPFRRPHRDLSLAPSAVSPAVRSATALLPFRGCGYLHRPYTLSASFPAGRGHFVAVGTGILPVASISSVLWPIRLGDPSIRPSIGLKGQSGGAARSHQFRGKSPSKIGHVSLGPLRSVVGRQLAAGAVVVTNWPLVPSLVATRPPVSSWLPVGYRCPVVVTNRLRVPLRPPTGWPARGESPGRPSSQWRATSCPPAAFPARTCTPWLSSRSVSPPGDPTNEQPLKLVHRRLPGLSASQPVVPTMVPPFQNRPSAAGCTSPLPSASELHRRGHSAT